MGSRYTAALERHMAAPLKWKHSVENTDAMAERSQPGAPQSNCSQQHSLGAPSFLHTSVLAVYTTEYLPTGALLSASMAANAPSFNNRVRSDIALCTATSVSPSTRIYSLGCSPVPGSLPLS